MNKKKIIEHDNQSFMFDGKYTEPIKKENTIESLSIKDIDFNNATKVAEYLVENKKSTAEALALELEMIILLKDK